MHNEMPILQNLLFAWVDFFHVRIYFNVNIQFQVTIKIYGTRFAVDIVISCFISCLHLLAKHLDTNKLSLNKNLYSSSTSKPIFSISYKKTRFIDLRTSIACNLLAISIQDIEFIMVTHVVFCFYFTDF